MQLSLQPSKEMSHKDRCFSICPGTVLSVFSLILYLGGFVRIEFKLNDYDGKLVAFKETVSLLKQHQEVSSSNEGKVVIFVCMMVYKILKV